jgi:hypothetical protein
VVVVVVVVVVAGRARVLCTLSRGGL